MRGAKTLSGTTLTRLNSKQHKGLRTDNTSVPYELRGLLSGDWELEGAKDMRLLLVEDDAKLADMVARSLREQGYAVDLAIDGLRAEQQARINEYDGIVLD